MSKSFRPKSRAEARTVPAITIENDDLYLMVLMRLAGEQIRLLDEDEFDVRFEHDDVAPRVLLALQRFPKPGRAYQLELDGEPIHVEQVTRTTFRITRRSRLLEGGLQSFAARPAEAVKPLPGKRKA